MNSYIHGTSYENAMHILQNGFVYDDTKTIWTCSNPDMLYCRKNDSDNDDNLYYCYGSAKIASAYTDSQSDKIAIIEIRINDEIEDEIIDDDCSCRNTCGCYQIDKESIDCLLNKHFIDVLIHIYSDCYNPYLRPFCLSGLSDEYMKINDPLLISAIDMVNKSENNICYDIMDYCMDDPIETIKMQR